MRKAMAGSLIALMMVAQTFTSHRAEAALGATVTASGVPLLGIPVMVAGGVTAGYGWTMLSNGCSDPGVLTGILCFFVAIPSIALLGIGVAALDDPSGSTVEFAELSPEAGEELRLTDTEIESFNGELPEIQAISESIQSEVVSRIENGEQIGSIDIPALWSAYREVISPEAFSALEAVSDRIAAGVTAQ